jgi:hypothetical protein
MHHWIPFHQDHMQWISMGGQQAWLCRNLMVACEASGAREHGHDSKQEKEWTRAFRRCNSWSTRARKSRRKNDRAGGNRGPGEHAATQVGRPRSAGLPYIRSLLAPVFCRQASLSFLSLCAQVCVPRTTIDIDNLPKLDSSKKIHNLNPLKVHIRK